LQNASLESNPLVIKYHTVENIATSIVANIVTGAKQLLLLNFFIMLPIKSQRLAYDI